MDNMAIIRKWFRVITETILSLIVLFALIEIILGQPNIPFIGQLNILDTLTETFSSLGTGAAAAIVFVWVIYNIYSKKVN